MFIQIIKWLGVIYLAWLGINCLRQAKVNRPPDNMINETHQQKAMAISYFVQGLLCNLTNPTAILFYSSLFVFILKTNTATWALGFYMITIVFLTGSLWFSAVAWLISHPRCRQYIQYFHFYTYLLLGVFLLTFSGFILFHEV